MTAHAIGNFVFAAWNGPGPGVPQQNVLTSVRPGVEGVFRQKAGKWGRQFEVELTSHWQQYQSALAGFNQYTQLIGGDAQQVKYNHVFVSSLYSVGYLVDGVDLIVAEQNVAIMGPNYLYSPGTALITRWRLTPQAL